MNLYSYFLHNEKRSIIKDVHYFLIYERYFSRYVNRPVLMFEIGTGRGGSAKMWKEYFGPLARIVTIDIVNREEVEETQIYVRTGDQSDEVFLRKLVDEFGHPDIVLDDGSHIMHHVNKSFDTLYELVKEDGIYLVEDLDTAYWETHGGGLGAPTSFIERSKALVDELNARNTGGLIPLNVFSMTTLSIAFFDKVIVFEKAPYINKEMLYIPKPE
jgi:hypothetical protein